MADRKVSDSIRDEEEMKFASIPLQEAVSAATVELGKKRKPRRVLHFSDGTLEEYSTDEEEEERKGETNRPTVDPSTLPWSKWFLHHLGSAAGNTLSAADYCGEKLAWFFGVTSPKYQYVLDEIQRRELEEREEKERAAREAEMHQNMQTEINVKVDSTASKLSTEPGYDNLVFGADENGQVLDKY